LVSKKLQVKIPRKILHVGVSPTSVQQSKKQWDIRSSGTNGADMKLLSHSIPSPGGGFPVFHCCWGTPLPSTASSRPIPRNLVKFQGENGRNPGSSVIFGGVPYHITWFFNVIEERGITHQDCQGPLGGQSISLSWPRGVTSAPDTERQRSYENTYESKKLVSPCPTQQILVGT